MPFTENYLIYPQYKDFIYFFKKTNFLPGFYLPRRSSLR